MSSFFLGGGDPFPILLGGEGHQQEHVARAFGGLSKSETGVGSEVGDFDTGKLVIPARGKQRSRASQPKPDPHRLSFSQIGLVYFGNCSIFAKQRAGDGRFQLKSELRRPVFHVGSKNCELLCGVNGKPK